jgi:hypothetical protein
VIQQIAPAALNPAFGNPVLPRTLEGGSDRAKLHGLDGSGHFEPVLCIAIKDQEPRRGLAALASIVNESEGESLFAVDQVSTQRNTDGRIQVNIRAAIQGDVSLARISYQANINPESDINGTLSSFGNWKM